MKATITIQPEDLITGVASNPVTAIIGFDIIYLKGDKGEKGDKGDRGEQGLQGAQGIQGLRGEKGEKGDSFTYNDFTPAQLASLKGEKGEQGIPGPQGEKGEKGDQGIQGAQGERGLQGEQGIQGVAGQDGTDGTDGISPTVSVSKSGSVTTVTVTDVNGQHTATINDGTNGNDGIFWAVQGTTTVQQIQDALDAGKVVYAVRDTFIYRLADNNSTDFRFFSFYNISTFKSFKIIKSSGEWSGGYTYSALLTSDKIASTSTVAATDDKWYTALKVQNLLNALQATIPTATKQFTVVYDDTTTETLNVTAAEVL